jgi:hypothetical protein
MISLPLRKWRCRVERNETSPSILLLGHFRFDLRFFSRACGIRMTVMKLLLDINSHRNGAGNILPAGALPEFSTAEIVIGHQDNSAHDASLA